MADGFSQGLPGESSEAVGGSFVALAAELNSSGGCVERASIRKVFAHGAPTWAFLLGIRRFMRKDQVRFSKIKNSRAIVGMIEGSLGPSVEMDSRLSERCHPVPENICSRLKIEDRHR